MTCDNEKCEGGRVPCPNMGHCPVPKGHAVPSIQHCPPGARVVSTGCTIPCPDCAREPCEYKHRVVGSHDACIGEADSMCPPGADEDCTVPRVTCEHYENVGPGCDHDGTRPCPEGADENCTVPVGGGDERCPITGNPLWTDTVSLKCPMTGYPISDEHPECRKCVTAPAEVLALRERVVELEVAFARQRQITQKWINRFGASGKYHHEERVEMESTIARMTPVYEAAVAYRDADKARREDQNVRTVTVWSDAGRALCAAVEKAEKEGK